MHGPSSSRRCNVPKQSHSLRHDSPRSPDIFGRIGGHQWRRYDDAIKKAFVKAKAVAHEKPLTELIADCKSCRKMIGEIRGKESVAGRVVGRRSRPARTAGSPSRSCGANTSRHSNYSEAEVSRFREEFGQCAWSLEHQHRPPTFEETVARGFRPQTPSRRQRCG